MPPLDVRDRVQASGPLAREPPDEPDPPVPESTEEALLRGMVANVVLKENILKTVFIFLTTYLRSLMELGAGLSRDSLLFGMAGAAPRCPQHPSQSLGLLGTIIRVS